MFNSEIVSPPLKVALIGATGRFGKAIATLLLQDPRFELAAAIAHPASPHLHLDFGAFLQLPPNRLSITADRESVQCDLYLDVSIPKALYKNLLFAHAAKRPIVIGTTGLSQKDHEEMRKTAEDIPLFYAPNFSLGIAILRKLASETARRFPAYGHIDLIETHHAQKKDSPSGSALLLAQTIQESTTASLQIHSLRSGQIIGEHTLLFNTPDERLTLSHQAHNRDAFARGALEAALFLSRQPPGFYTMDSLLA